ncbi:hypothetical protein BN7_6087 [Wickerhamomyces ciferrii]|uniref:Respiratory growth induced protein 2 n=1 Tax=Wickerhamomyces ciferrii (strain ATCC 14091 / BCRC 22168 / CBS 111 / JCM 3599 / NBRC 0793 / NRRL Y-1031 F-60-10) TaxID=1206466 RepID=K0KYI3_WICCF|nr:uncharacterized protein BN7_6087 [Wickerhamomyces ciferrii]CCH46494.1 hypothetical protein BN7_6087 [Wickerhamomyces ciferrii]
MAKKDKQQKKKLSYGKLQEFEDLDTFEQFLKDEREDNEHNNAHAHINYIPPFVLAASHNDPDKVKDSQNRKNKKFVRHLHQHVEKHLIKDIKASSGMDLNFGKPETIEDFDTITWKYTDSSDHGLGLDGEKFKVEVVVKCNSNGAYVDVNYNTLPITEDLQVPV